MLLLARLSAIDGVMFVPAISLLGGWTLAGLLGSGLQFLLDPWDLRSGDGEWRRVRAMLGADIVPDLAVVLALFVTATQLLGAA
ncbi:MAG: hypothetical protein U5K33_09175 [Halofilum sp. (in: g-proteobacteria)]|nr:hypothetical protein [Halofilum sp. (in: g-proteobacteria)]